MRKDRVGWEESAYSRVCLIDIMAKGLGTYSAEGAYWSLGAYLRLWYMMKICGFEKKNCMYRDKCNFFDKPSQNNLIHLGNTTE